MIEREIETEIIATAMAPPQLLPLMRPLVAVPVALRAANTIMGLLVLQGITMSMWRGMLNRVSDPLAQPSPVE